jgi:hypothetical protein
MTRKPNFVSELAGRQLFHPPTVHFLMIRGFRTPAVVIMSSSKIEGFKRPGI